MPAYEDTAANGLFGFPFTFLSFPLFQMLPSTSLPSSFAPFPLPSLPLPQAVSPGSLSPSVCLSVCLSVGRSVGRSIGRSIGRCICRSIARSVGRLLARSPSLLNDTTPRMLPTSINHCRMLRCRMALAQDYSRTGLVAQRNAGLTVLVIGEAD